MKLFESQPALDFRLTQALETAPAVRIPADFAARIASQVPPLHVHAPVTASITPRHYGRNAAIVSMAVLLVLIFAVAHLATGSSLLWITAEWIFCAQFTLLAVWLAARRSRPYSAWQL
jgi:hypothetical protein